MADVEYRQRHADGDLLQRVLRTNFGSQGVRAWCVCACMNGCVRVGVYVVVWCECMCVCVCALIYACVHVCVDVMSVLLVFCTAKFSPPHACACACACRLYALLILGHAQEGVY